MTSSKVQNLQLSDWSISSPVTFHHQQLVNGENQINIRSDSIYPRDVNQNPSKNRSKKSKRCKPLQCWSSTPPFVRGLLLGILTGCLILAIILPLWLIKGPSTQANTSIALLRWHSSAITIASNRTSSNISNSLRNPYGFTIDSSSTLYIVDYGNNRIMKWLAGASNGIIIAGQTSGTSGNGTNEFRGPVDVLVETNGDMYITDRINNRLQFWPNGASSGMTIAGAGSNSSISLMFPSGIVRNPSTNTLYIACFSGHQIVSYPSGSVVAGGNGQGFNRTQLNGPIGLVYDSFSKSLIIANYFGHNIVRWVLNASNWTHIAGSLSGLSSNTSTLLDGPVGVTLDPMGNIYVVDSSNYRIQLFLNGESEGKTIAGISGVFGSDATHLKYPYWVKLDDQLNLYVSDFYNGRIQKFLRY